MSKFTGLKKGIVGVCAATLLTGIVAAPAFAEDFTDPSFVSTDKVYTDGATESMVVTAQALSSAQIHATVPTTVKAAVSASGDLTFPTTNFKVELGDKSADSWRVKVTSIETTAGTDLSLVGTTDAVNAEKTLFLSLNNTALSDTPITSGALIDSFAQAASGTPTDVNLSMSGKMYNPSYSQVKDGVNIATLKWTIALV